MSASAGRLIIVLLAFIGLVVIKPRPVTEKKVKLKLYIIYSLHDICAARNLGFFLVPLSMMCNITVVHKVSLQMQQLLNTKK